MTGGLSEADISRMTRSGVGAISSEHGLELFDSALGAGEALMLPIPLDFGCCAPRQGWGRSRRCSAAW